MCWAASRRSPLPGHVLGILRTVIDRDQVLHVARLARLALSDDEVETMARELSGILEHVDRISQLDLEGVEPTSHVVELENVLRPDEPRPSWPREKILEPAPEPERGAFRVPSPQAEG
jgi:aspartyl-tRNA(Asn)/glutamyl-tRNA(Gln) amidotransferase subunit C